MAADVSASAEYDTICDVLRSMSPEICAVLCQIRSLDHDELITKLVECANFKMLMDNRSTVFRAAMDKVDLCLSQVAKARAENVYSVTEVEEEMIKRAESLLRSLTPKDMIQRKSMKKVADDIVDLLEFTLAENANFPARMIRTGNNKQGTVKPQQDSIVEALAHLQHIANLIPDEICSPGGINDIEHGELGDETNLLENQMYAVRVYDDALGASNDPLQENESDMYACSESGTRTLITNELNNMNEANCEYLEGDRLPSEHSSVNSMEGERSEDEETQGKVYLVREMASQPGTSNMNGQNRNAMVREIAQKLDAGNGDSDLPSYDPIAIDSNIINIWPYDDNTPDASVGVGSRYKSNAESQGTDGDHDWNDSVWWISFRQPVEKDKGPNPKRAVESEQQLPSTYANQIPGVRKEQRNQKSAASDAGNTQSYANRGRDIGARMCRQNQSTTDTEREQTTGRKNFTETETGEEQGENIFPTPFKISFTVGNVMINMDVSDLTKMASRAARDQSPTRGRRRENLKPSCECRECRTRLDAQDRRIDDLENLIAERTSELKVSTDELCDEIRNVRINVDNQGPDPILITPSVPEVKEVGRLARNVRTVPAGAPIPAGKQSKVSGTKAKPRPRAASFAGLASAEQLEAGGEWRRTRKEVKMVPNSPEVVPKPQRVEPRRGRAGRRNGNVGEQASKPREGAMREWLSTASRDQPRNSGSDRRATAERSPSWADEPVPEDDEFDTSNSLTPTPDGDRRRDNMPPQCSPSSPDNSDHDSQVQDVYQLPPSGQVTEQRGRRNGNPRAGASGGYGGARPKTRGKPNAAHEGNFHNAKGSKKSNMKENKASYSKVVTNSGWKTVQSKKRKYDNSSPRNANPLRGIAMTRNRDVYLQGLLLDDCGTGSGEDVIDSVKAYCRDRGIKAVYIKLIPVKFDDTRTGCRLTVKEDDFKRVVREEFWPDHIKAREWTQRPRDGYGNDGGEENTSSDENE